MRIRSSGRVTILFLGHLSTQSAGCAARSFPLLGAGSTSFVSSKKDATKPRRKMSAAGRKRIVDAQKAKRRRNNRDNLEQNKYNERPKSDIRVSRWGERRNFQRPESLPCSLTQPQERFHEVAFPPSSTVLQTHSPSRRLRQRNCPRAPGPYSMLPRTEGIQLRLASLM
jgi:hypothetical protein